MNLARLRLNSLAVIAWVSPCSVMGLAFALPVVLAGGSARRIGRVLEVNAGSGTGLVGSAFRRLPWSAITLGHVIIGANRHELRRLRAHELVHVRQFEQWGPFFLAAYTLASLVALLAGKGLYAGNWFERQAIKAEGPRRNTG